MGQSSSSQSSPPPSALPEILGCTHSKDESSINFPDSYIDYTSEIHDDCLALIFNFLRSGDRKRCSLVSKRWLLVESQSRHRLAVTAQSDLFPFIPSMFSRFDSVNKLYLGCDRGSVSIDDTGLILISLRCRNLKYLKLHRCREITDISMAAVAKNCKQLKKFSCGWCAFGAKGMNALLDNCCSLEKLSVKRLHSVDYGATAEQIRPDAAATSLRTIVLKKISNSQMFGPLISVAKKLKKLKLLGCVGD